MILNHEKIAADRSILVLIATSAPRMKMPGASRAFDRYSKEIKRASPTDRESLAAKLQT
jgi:hypothetical protein